MTSNNITFIDASSSLAEQVRSSIQSGDIAGLKQLLQEHPHLVTSYIGNHEEARSLLHIATDWPGHFPQGPETVKILVSAGADINSRFIGAAHKESPLHWAASCDDVAVLDALLDAGAEIDPGGGVIANGTPLTDARAFVQLKAARRLVERGATVTLQDAGLLGLLDHLEGAYNRDVVPAEEEMNCAFWNACRGGQLEAARFLHGKGADINFSPSWAASDEDTPLAAARESGNDDLADFLAHLGAKTKGSKGP